MGQIELNLVLGLDALRSRPPLDLNLQPPKVINRPRSHHPSHSDTETRECPTHEDIRGITTCTVPLPTLQKAQERNFDAWVRQILWEGTASDDKTSEPPMEILRAKGIYWTHAGDQVILQAVRMLYEFQRLPSEGEAREGKLVLIGKGLHNATRLSESLAYHLSQTM
jgi:G3E family GTPase